MPVATVKRNEPAGEGLRLLTLDLSLPAYDRPGQFVTARVEGLEPAFFAIASSPGEPVQLLVKTRGDVAERIGALAPEDALEISEPIGRGFPVPDDAGELVILCNGSALSATRPLVRAELARGLPRTVHLYLGVLSLAHRPFADELSAWERSGVRVVTVLDQPQPGWEGPVGHVQDVAAANGLARPDVTVVLCGYPQMIAQTRAMWAAAGCPPERLVVNF